MRKLPALLIAIAVPLGVAQAAGKPTLIAPSTAKIGSKIHVVAKNLKPQRYAVRLFTRGQAPHDDTCVAMLTKQSKRKITHLDVTVTIPRRLSCFSGFPASADGSIKTVPGTYSLVVSVPASINTTAAAGSDQIRKIKLR